MGKMLGIGHAATPESILTILSCTPKSSPWLFPYDLWHWLMSMASRRSVTRQGKKSLLMYHDKRFQLEPMFPLVAINHEQIRAMQLVVISWQRSQTSQQNFRGTF